MWLFVIFKWFACWTSQQPWGWDLNHLSEENRTSSFLSYQHHLAHSAVKWVLDCTLLMGGWNSEGEDLTIFLVMVVLVLRWGVKLNTFHSSCPTALLLHPKSTNQWTRIVGVVLLLSCYVVGICWTGITCVQEHTCGNFSHHLNTSYLTNFKMTFASKQREVLN